MTSRQEPPQAAAAPRRSGWRSPRGRRAGAALLGAAAGAALAVAMPYGPVTTAQVAVGMLAGAVTGFAAGLVAGSRVALALAPLANLAAFELVRRPPDVPSVGRIELGSSWGILVLVLGRGVYALLVLAPTLVAAAYGAGLARRRARTPRGRARLAWPRRAVCALAALGLAGATVLADTVG